MAKSIVKILLSVLLALVIAGGVVALVWWLVDGRGSDDTPDTTTDYTPDITTDYTPDTTTEYTPDTTIDYTPDTTPDDTPDYTLEVLDGDGLGGLQHTAAIVRIRDAGDLFWWFYPTLAAAPASRPIVLWLDGVTGLPPSLLANFGMFGPLDFNLNRRNDSWIDEYNLLFVDAPLGTGFSTTDSDSGLTKNLDDTARHLHFTLTSFYTHHEDFADTPLYIFGEGHGAQLALALAIRVLQRETFSSNLKGVILGNGIISPALALTKLGFYLEEMGYIDGTGRIAIEEFSAETNRLVDAEEFEEAFNKFLSLGDYVNENAGAVAVNLGHLIEKLTREPTRDYFGQKEHLRSIIGDGIDVNEFMVRTVAPALGLSIDTYDHRRESAIQAFGDYFMRPADDKVEYILQNSDVVVTIYNGNLDAVSNTPGQLEWVNHLEWTGQDAFRSSPRQTLIVNGLVEGYFRETARLKFYWMNVAGQSVPLDSPAAMRRVLGRITA